MGERGGQTGEGNQIRPMKITIDATGLSRYRTGTVTYLVEILTEWNLNSEVTHEFLIFCTSKTRGHFDKLSLDQRFRLVILPSTKVYQMVWQQTGLPYYLWRNKVDVHWGVGFVLPILGRCPAVVTIHDMTFDLFPSVHEPIKRLYFPFMIRRSIKRASRVLAISDSTARDLARLIPASASKTAVTHLAARPLCVSQEKVPLGKVVASVGVGLGSDGGSEMMGRHNGCAPVTISKNDRPYVLFIGSIEPRKNLGRLLQAWKCLSLEVEHRHRLIVVGVKGWMVDDLSTELDETVTFVGHVADLELQGYLHGATCFVYPSLYEGFGLPVIEAMATGVPVLTSNIGATLEIAGSAAVLVDPMSVDSIRHGLRRLLQDVDLRRELSKAGMNRAKDFSWRKTASLTLDALEISGLAR